MEDILGDGSFIDFENLSRLDQLELVDAHVCAGKISQNQARKLLDYPELDNVSAYRAYPPFIAAGTDEANRKLIAEKAKNFKSATYGLPDAQGPFVVPPKPSDRFEGFCETCSHGVYISGGVTSKCCDCTHAGMTLHDSGPVDPLGIGYVGIKGMKWGKKTKDVKDSDFDITPRYEATYGNVGNAGREEIKNARIHSASITEAGKGLGEIRTTSSTGAEKGMKPERYDLIPVEAMAIVARLYGKGAEKYAAHNWRKGYEWSKSYSAMQRHGTQFWGGEDIDEEMGLPHLAGVVFHALSLMTFMIEHPEFDDRYKAETPEISDEL